MWSIELAEDEHASDSGAKRQARRRQASGGRNAGWYIPFWRKPRRGQSDQALAERSERRRKPRARSDQDLDRVREEWVERYNARLHALSVLDLSMGTPKEDIAQRFDALRARYVLDDDGGAEQLRALDAAFALLRSEL